jgi:hypothetical protein
MSKKDVYIKIVDCGLVMAFNQFIHISEPEGLATPTV